MGMMSTLPKIACLQALVQYIHTNLNPLPMLIRTDTILLMANLFGKPARGFHICHLILKDRRIAKIAAKQSLGNLEKLCRCTSRTLNLERTHAHTPSITDSKLIIKKLINIINFYRVQRSEKRLFPGARFKSPYCHWGFCRRCCCWLKERRGRGNCRRAEQHRHTPTGLCENTVKGIQTCKQW